MFRVLFLATLDILWVFLATELAKTAKELVTLGAATPDRVWLVWAIIGLGSLIIFVLNLRYTVLWEGSRRAYERWIRGD